MDYVKTQTAHSGTVFGKSNALSKVRISSIDIANDKSGFGGALEPKQQQSTETDLVFNKNRTTHTNRLDVDSYSFA